MHILASVQRWSLCSSPRIEAADRLQYLDYLRSKLNYTEVLGPGIEGIGDLYFGCDVADHSRPAALPEPKYRFPNQSTVRSNLRAMVRPGVWPLVSAFKDKRQLQDESSRPEIGMSKPRLRLVCSSNDAQPEALIWQRGRGLRPLVLPRDGRTEPSASELSVWEAGLELVHLGLLTSCRNYAAFVQASIAVLDLCTTPEVAWQFEPAERTRER